MLSRSNISLARTSQYCLSRRRPLHSSPRLPIEWSERGHDITFESLNFGSRPKVIIQGFAPTGFDVLNMVKKVDEKYATESGTLHMNGSILAVPFGCFLWKVESPADVTIESLAPVFLHQPRLEYLFIGCDHAHNNNSKNSTGSRNDSSNLQPIAAEVMDGLKMALSTDGHNCVVEQMSLANAIGTFNILNAEERNVAVALIIDQHG